MPPFLQNVIGRLPPGAQIGLARAWQEAVGLAQDFWKDGHWQDSTLQEEDESVDAESALPPPGQLWHALPGEIAEKMWGPLCVMPGDRTLADRLIAPLGLTREMNLLDLSAGLGVRLRQTADKFGVYIDGCESDPDIAARGMALAKSARSGKHAVVRHYDPMTLAAARSYDCVVARETIYRAADKTKYVGLVAACCKKKAQLSFTDYIVDPESRHNPGIAAWQAFEPDANPPSLVEMAELWAKYGFTLRVHDDQTDYYKKEVLSGLARFVTFLNSGVTPDAETRGAIHKTLKMWAHRLGAFQGGMKFYRFYGLR